MAKYILHGGETRIHCKNNSDFFAEITKDLKEPVKILVVYFSRPKEEWNNLLQDDEINFSSNANGKKIELILASKNIKEFIKQIKNADAVYMRGGKFDILKSQLEKVKNLRELLSGKTIAGSSAGAMVLSECSHSRSSASPFRGLAIIPIRVVVHYSKVLEDKLKELEKYGDEKIKTYAIPETEFIILK